MNELKVTGTQPFMEKKHPCRSRRFRPRQQMRV